MDRRTYQTALKNKVHQRDIGPVQPGEKQQIERLRDYVKTFDDMGDQLMVTENVWTQVYDDLAAYGTSRYGLNTVLGEIEKCRNQRDTVHRCSEEFSVDIELLQKECYRMESQIPISVKPVLVKQLMEKKEKPLDQQALVQLEKEFRTFEEKMVDHKKKCDEIENLLSRMQNLEEKSKNWNRETFVSSLERNCFKCGRAGHKMYQCWSNGCAAPVEKKRVCFGCGMEGHFRRNCLQQTRHFSDQRSSLRCGNVSYNEKDCERRRKLVTQGCSRICFGCGDMGHIRRRCPNLQWTLDVQNERRPFRPDTFFLF